MADPLIRKLEQFVRLSSRDKMVLRSLANRIEHFPARADIVREGDPPTHVNLVLSGIASRYRMLEDGRRQIIGLFVPGDVCDARMFVLRTRDHSIAAISDVHVAHITKDAIVAATDGHPHISRAFWWNTLVEESIAREWIVSLGRRSAYERMAHLLCEYFIRMRAVGLVKDNSCFMPLTQAELADALGISVVHANRTLMALRAEGFIILRASQLLVLDLAGLMAAALFNPNYLHMDHEGSDLDANAP